MRTPHHRTPWLLKPFALLWQLIAAVIRVTGRLVAVLAGIALVFVGFFVSMTLVGAIAGVPMIICGMLLVARSIFG